MKNYLMALSVLAFLIMGHPLNQFSTYSHVETKAGCLDEEAINYCLDCSTEGGECLYDNESSYRCEEPLVRWKKRWNPRSEWNDEFVVFTIERCWVEWEITLYDFLGKEVWLSFDPTDKWSGMTAKNDYVEAGTYLLSIKAETRGGTKKLDILTEVEIFYEDDK